MVSPEFMPSQSVGGGVIVVCRRRPKLALQTQLVGVGEGVGVSDCDEGGLGGEQRGGSLKGRKDEFWRLDRGVKGEGGVPG